MIDKLITARIRQDDWLEVLFNSSGCIFINTYTSGILNSTIEISKDDLLELIEELDKQL
jgi:hypothetical protein